MKKIFLILISFGLYAQTFPQRVIFNKGDPLEIPINLANKIGSGELLKRIYESQTATYDKPASQHIEVVIYTSEYPSENILSDFKNKNINPVTDTWIPPTYSHPYGFFIAQVPVDKITDILDNDFVKRIDIADDISYPQNNQASKLVNADRVWKTGLSGKGIKVAVLDSGLDTTFMGTDLPSSIQKKDYSVYPNLDDDIANRVTGHGTHVTGIVLGKGALSENNSGNGGGSYSGIAPDAELIFLKIGNDNNGAASSYAIIEAMKAAVNDYNADIITMSYGGWDLYHDGSNIKDQTVDWCYEQGVPVFLPAGNEGLSKRHYSGYVSANDSSELIRVEINDVEPNSAFLCFNLVWFDGNERKNLTLKYYDNTGEEMQFIYHWPNTESIRGTESHLSQSCFPVEESSTFYYLRVINLSDSPQNYHIYEYLNNEKITFTEYDPNYTIISPGTADHAFTVGAFVSRTEWACFLGSIHSEPYGEIGSIASYSSRGPRIDGLQKPDILAPGSSIISLMDKNVYTNPNMYTIDDDGIPSGNVDYLFMNGTSMATPFCAGAAALYLEKYPNATPEEIYSALRNNAMFDQQNVNSPGTTQGYGKLDAYAAVENGALTPVELIYFNGYLENENVELIWRTATETNNYGFEIERGQKLLDNKTVDFQTIGFVNGNGNSSSISQYSFVDREEKLRGTFVYRLKQIDFNGEFSYSNELEIDFITPNHYELLQNYPNPFNPVTNIKFAVPKATKVNLNVYNLLGEKVATLLNEEKEAGYYNVKFDGSGFTSGVYIFRLFTENYVKTKKMNLIK